MREFRVAPEDFNALPRDPAILFALAIGIVGDVAAIVADQIGGDADAAPEALPRPLGWGEMDADPQDALRFASLFFDAYLNAASTPNSRPNFRFSARPPTISPAMSAARP